MRQRIRNILGSPVNTPGLTPQSTLSVTDPGAQSNRAPAQAQLFDFSALSPILTKLAQERVELRDKQFIDAGARYANLIKAGKTPEQALREITESADTPAAIRGRLAKNTTLGANPAFRLGSETKAAEYALLQYRRDATEQIEEAALEIAQLKLEDQGPALERKMQEWAEYASVHFEGLGYFGRAAAEERISEVDEKLSEDLLKRIDEQRQSIYLKNTGAVLESKLEDYRAAETPEEREAIVAQISNDLNGIRLDMNLEAAQAIAAQTIRNAAGYVERTKGPTAAAEVLGDLMDDLKGYGNDSLLRNSQYADEIYREIGALERRGKQDQALENELTASALRNAQTRLEIGPVGTDLLNAAERGPSYVESAYEAIRREFENTDSTVFFETYGVAEEDQPFFLQNLRESYETNRRRADAGFSRSTQDSYKRTRREIRNLLYAEGVENKQGLAIELINAPGNEILDVQDIKSLRAYAEELFSPDNGKSYRSNLTQTFNFAPLIEKALYRNLQDPLAPDGSIPTQATQVYSTRLNAELTQIDKDVDAIFDNTETHEDAFKALREYESTLRTRLLQEYPQYGLDKPKSATPEDLAEEAEATAASRSNFEQFQMAERGSFTLGNLPDQRAPRDIKKLSLAIIDNPLKERIHGRKGFFSFRTETKYKAGSILKKLRTSLDEADDITTLEKQAVVAQTLGYSGMLTLDGLVALSEGNVGRVRDSVQLNILGYTDNPNSLEGEDANERISRQVERDEDLSYMSAALGPLDQYVEAAGIADINPYLLRVPGFEDTAKYVKKDRTQSTNVAYVSPADLPPELLEQTTKLLELFDIPVTGENMAQMFQAQTDNWGN